jgi:hypothetical protein
MRFLTAGFLALLALAALAGAALFRKRAVDAGRSLRDQFRVALRWLSGAFVATLVALAVRGETVLAALPGYLRRGREILATLARDLVAAVRAREFDLGRLPGPRAILARLLAAVRGLFAGVRESLPGSDATPDPDGPAATDTDTTADAPDARERVRRAWREFRAQVPVADHRTKTPGELAREGVDAGFPRSAVRTLRDAIRDVEYGRRDPAAYVDDVDDARRELTTETRTEEATDDPESAPHATDGGAEGSSDGGGRP